MKLLLKEENSNVRTDNGEKGSELDQHATCLVSVAVVSNVLVSLHQVLLIVVVVNLIGHYVCDQADPAAMFSLKRTASITDHTTHQRHASSFPSQDCPRPPYVGGTEKWGDI